MSSSFVLDQMGSDDHILDGSWTKDYVETYGAAHRASEVSSA